MQSQVPYAAMGGGGGMPQQQGAGQAYDRQTGRPLKQVDRDIDSVVNYDMRKEAQTERSKVTVRILIVGDPGVGKSSFINTARAVFNKQTYEEDAGVGEGGATVTEFAESYYLLRSDKDHIRFTDTRGFYGVTEETCANIQRLLSRQMTKRKNMDNYEQESVSCMRWYKTLTWKWARGVFGVHHACILFVDTCAVADNEDKFNELIDNIVNLFSTLQVNLGMRICIFLTKIDKMMTKDPTFDVEQFKRAVCAATATWSSQNRLPDGSMLELAPSQLHSIMSVGNRDEWDEAVAGGTWPSIQQMHAKALVAVLGDCAAYIRAQPKGPLDAVWRVLGPAPRSWVRELSTVRLAMEFGWFLSQCLQLSHTASASASSVTIGGSISDSTINGQWVPVGSVPVPVCRGALGTVITELGGAGTSGASNGVAGIGVFVGITAFATTALLAFFLRRYPRPATLARLLQAAIAVDATGAVLAVVQALIFAADAPHSLAAAFFLASLAPALVRALAAVYASKLLGEVLINGQEEEKENERMRASLSGMGGGGMAHQRLSSSTSSSVPLQPNGLPEADRLGLRPMAIAQAAFEPLLFLAFAIQTGVWAGVGVGAKGPKTVAALNLVATLLAAAAAAAVLAATAEDRSYWAVRSRMRLVALGSAAANLLAVVLTMASAFYYIHADYCAGGGADTPGRDGGGAVFFAASAAVCLRLGAAALGVAFARSPDAKLVGVELVTFRYCPACGAMNDIDGMFCAFCGQKMGAA